MQLFRTRRAALLAAAAAVALAGCDPAAPPEAAAAPAPAPWASADPATGTQPAPRPGTRAPAAAVSAAEDGVPATRDELATLRAALGVPVHGVPRSALRDSYHEKRGDRVHRAMDVLAERGTPVLSAADGRVLKMHESEAGGLMVYAADPSGRFILLYGHLDRYAHGLGEGAPLARGQVIGYVGSTGNASADNPHLHFEVLRGRPDAAWWRGVPANPYPLLAR